MKKFLTLMLFVPAIAFAQKNNKDEKIILPTDSSNHLISFQEVVRVDSIAKDELYVRAREWFARTFVSSQSVIQMEDKAAGKIIGKATSSGFYYILLTPTTYTLSYTVSITVKEGRYRYEISPFLFDGYPSEGQYTVYAKGKGIGMSIAKKVVPHIYATGQTLSSSIKESMSKISKGVKMKDDF